MKKGVFASIIVSIILTLTLAITTIATAFGGATVPEKTVYLAYRTEDVCSELKDYKQINFGFDTADENSMLVYDETESAYVAKNAGKTTVKAKNKNNKQVNLTIEVFSQGNGQTAETPWVVTNAGHLIELSTLVNAGNFKTLGADVKFVELKADIDMSGQTGFKPIGTRTNAFSASFVGGDKAIINLEMNVTASNYNDYVSLADIGGVTEAFIELGVFGTINAASIKNLNVVNSKFTVAEDVVSTIRAQIAEDKTVVGNAERVRLVTVGAVAANAIDSTIDGVSASSSINSLSFSDETGGAFDNGVGGVVGVASGSQIRNVTSNAKFILNQQEGVTAGGVVAVAKLNTTVENAKATVNAQMVYNNGALLGGLAGKMYASTILNSTVEGIAASGNETFLNIKDASTINTAVAGVAGLVNNMSTLTNVIVKNAAVDVKGIIAGVAYQNEGVINNCAFNGNLTGYAVAGMVSKNNNKIVFSDSFDGVAVSGYLKGVRVGGAVEINKGSVTGGANKPKIDVTVKSVSKKVEGAKALKAIYESYVSGFAVEHRSGTISGFNVKVELIDGLNMAGLVNIMGETGALVNAATLTDMMVDASVTSGSLQNSSTTYSIAGAVGFTYAGATIDNNAITLNVNQKAVADNWYGVAQLGGIVARVYEGGVTISNNTLSAKVFINYAGYSAQIGDTMYSQMLIGGLVGSIATDKDVDGNVITKTEIVGGEDIEYIVDAHGKLNGSAMVHITGNQIENLEVDYSFEGFETIVSGIESIRGVGGIVGYNGADDSIMDFGSTGSNTVTRFVLNGKAQTAA